MIQLYPAQSPDYTKNGIMLHPTKATVTFQDGGRWDLEMTLPAGGSERRLIDYGMHLMASVAPYTIPSISMGTISYWQIPAGSAAVPLYKTITQPVRYAEWAWENPYSVGSKVTCQGFGNYQCLQYDGSSDYIMVPPYNSSWWKKIPDRIPGTVITSLAAGTQLTKLSDYNSAYMLASTLAGQKGYIEKAKCQQVGNAEPYVIPAKRITKQPFEVRQIKKDQSSGSVIIHAVHDSYDLGGVLLGGCSMTDATPQTALVFIAGAMNRDYDGDLITNINVGRVTADWSWKNAQSALLDPKEGYVQAVHGYVYRDGKNVYIIPETDEGTASYAVLYGVNMKAVIWTGDTDNLVTRVYPIAKNQDGSDLMLPERYIETTRTLPVIREKPLPVSVKVGQKIEQADGISVTLTEADVLQRMREEATACFTADHCDQPVITLELDFAHMPDTEEYAQYTALKNAEPHGWLLVRHGPMDIDTVIRMTGYQWDPLLDRYIKTSYGQASSVPSVASYQLGSGAVTARTLAGGSVSGSALQAKAISAEHIETRAITSDRIAAKTITSEVIAAQAVTADELAAGSVTTEKLVAAAITAGKIAAEAVESDKIKAGAVTAGKIAAGAVTAGKIAAEAVTADKIAAGAIQAAHLSTEVLETVDARIGSASIGYAQIKDATVQNLIARDAVTDRYFIDKLAVRSAQMVQATVGELVVKASDGRYYRLDVAADGSVSPTQVTPTAAEIAAGVTSDGHGAIIETDLTVAELSASNMKAINALIDKLTAGRIDVDTLFARQATVNQLLAMDITGNQYLRLMVKRTFSQWTDPAADPLISFVQDGDIWDRNSHIRTWNELGEFTWNQAAAYRWVDLEASDQFVRRNGEWTPMNLNTQARAVQAQMLLEQDALKLRVDSQETDIAGLKARVTTVETVYSEQGIRDIIATEFTEQIDGLIDDAAGEAIEKLLSTRLAFLQWEEPAGTEEDPLIDGMVWAKDHGYRTWNDVSAVPWAEMESCTWDSFLGPRFYVYKSGAWVLVTDYGRQVSETVRLDRTVEGVSANTERIARVGDHLSSLTAEFTVGFGEITARVTQVEADVDTKYTVRSGVDILPAGIEISGGKYVKIKSGGLFTVESGNFAIDGSGNVSLTGAITSQSGTIGGWTLGADKLSSGSGTNYVHVASGGAYAFLAGNATEASAPFRVKRDGTVYLTKLIALDENNQETNVNLRTAGLWKLGSANIKNASVSGSTLTIQRYSGGDLTVNFNTAASVTLESAWSGSGREHTFTVTASNGQSAGAKLTLSTYGDDYTSFNASHKKQITVGATGIGHPGGSGLVYQFDVDASGVFQEGKGSVTLTVGAWTNGKAAVTASNGQTAEVSLPTFSASASAFLNHKSTVTFATPSVQAALKTVTVDATEEYEAGYAAGWAAARAKISRNQGNIYGPPETVDGSAELLYEVTAGGSISSITNVAAKTYVANGRAIALVNNVSVDEKLLSKTQVFN